MRPSTKLASAALAVGALGAALTAAPAGASTPPAPPEPPAPTCTCPPAAPTTAAAGTPAAPGAATTAPGGDATAAPATTAPGGATTAPGATTAAPTTAPGATTPAAPGGGVPANATLDQLKTAITAMSGSQADFNALLTPWGLSYATPIPVPEGAFVYEVSLSLRPDEDPDWSTFDAEFQFNYTGNAADVVALYQTSLTGAGFTQTADATSTEDGTTQRQMEFTNSADSDDVIDVTVADFAEGTDAARVRFGGSLGEGNVAAFHGWYGDISSFGAVTTEDGRFFLSGSFSSSGEASVSITSRAFVAGTTAADLKAAILAAGTFGNLSVDPENDPADDWIDITGEGLNRGTLFLNDRDAGDNPGVALSIEGSFRITLPA